MCGNAQAKVSSKRYAHDTIFTNPADSNQDFEILVHECVVSDEASKKMVPIVDLEGCVMDNILLGGIQYDGQRRAYAETHVYKYSDLSSIFFMCNIRICSPMHDNCQDQTV